MATTPALALPYLAWTDAPDLPANNQALAQAVETILSGRIQHGSEVVVGTGANYVETTVTFPVPFTTTPKVFANYLTTTGGAKYMYANVLSATPTTATFRIVRDNPATTFSDPRRLAWLAIGI